MKIKIILASICSIVLALSFLTKSNSDPQNPSVELGKKTREVEDIARSVTIRIFSIGTKKMGSGVLVKRTPFANGHEYIVLTNAHVLGSEYEKNCTSLPNNSRLKIETPDGRNYGASLHPQSRELCKKKLDLAFLSFNSNTVPVYEIAKIEPSKTTKTGEEIYLSGFPCSVDACNKVERISINSGILSKLSEPLLSGYQIGYKIDTQPGTSGGAILNNRGQLIGIHGRGTNRNYSIVPDEEFKFNSNRNASKEERNLISSNSWAIPSEQFISMTNQLKDSFENTNKNDDKNIEISKLMLSLLEENNAKLQAIENKVKQQQEQVSQEKNHYVFLLYFISIIVSLNTIFIITMILKKKGDDI
jgi:S1-C subfamily serine protease